ncbi:MAG: ribonuclease P protein component [Acidimicrobiales bacterium]
MTVVPGRVDSRRQFARFSSPTSRGSSGPLRVLVVSDDELSSARVAYAIGRAVGSAVVRNRVRRRLRSLFDSLEPAPRPGLYLVKCGIETGRLSFDELHQHLGRALDRAGAL